MKLLLLVAEKYMLDLEQMNNIMLCFLLVLALEMLWRQGAVENVSPILAYTNNIRCYSKLCSAQRGTREADKDTTAYQPTDGRRPRGARVPLTDSGRALNGVNNSACDYTHLQSFVIGKANFEIYLFDYLRVFIY
jgi:hypothetical protein